MLADSPSHEQSFLNMGASPLPNSLPWALIPCCLQSSFLIYPSFLLMLYLVVESLLPSL